MCKGKLTVPEKSVRFLKDYVLDSVPFNMESSS